MQKENLTEIASKYIEIVNQIKKLEEEKEKLRKKLIDSEKEKITTEKGTIRIFTKKNAIIDNEKVIFTLNRKELIEVATISVAKFRKLAESKHLDINNFIIDYKITKEVKIIPPENEQKIKNTTEDIEIEDIKI